MPCVLFGKELAQDVFFVLSTFSVFVPISGVFFVWCCEAEGKLNTIPNSDRQNESWALFFLFVTEQEAIFLLNMNKNSKKNLRTE